MASQLSSDRQLLSLGGRPQKPEVLSDGCRLFSEFGNRDGDGASGGDRIADVTTVDGTGK